jgi:beta-lactamase class D
MNLRVLALAAVVPWAGRAAEEPAFVLLRGDGLHVENEGRAEQRFSPCSTFKIANSLIALQTGVASDAEWPLPYDPARDGEQHGAWSRDHTLASAIRVSAVWFYQEVARRIGANRMRDWVRRFEYGNMATTPAIDRFWLGQDLRISAGEQVDFLRRLHDGRLDVRPQVHAEVHHMLLLETGRDYRWYGKTGTCRAADSGWVAWHVGYVERNGGTAYYALNLGGASFAEVAARRSALVREKLAGAGLVARQAPKATEQMRWEIESRIAALPGTVSLFAINLETRETFSIRPDELVRTASTIKLPIMAAVFSAVAQGTASWDERIEMRAEDKVSGTGVIRELADGTKLTLRDLVHTMIVVSDNTATNLLLDRFSADFVNAEMDKLGLRQTRVLRKIMGNAPSGHSREGLQEEYRKYGLGVSTPREMADLMARLARGDVVNAEASAGMLAILGRQQFKDGIGRRLPGDWVASKSGSLDRLHSDVGLVSSTGGRLAVAITVDDMLRTDYSADNAGSRLIGDVARALAGGLSVPLHELGEPERVTTLGADMDHVQGIYLDGARLWVSWVDRKARTGHLGEFEAKTGRLVRSVPVHEGDRFHPGGIAGEGNSIWVPVAEYRPHSSAVIQKRNRDTLALEAEFDVADHIGCIASAGDRLYGGNWDSRKIYTWTPDGRLLATAPNTAGTSYQDLKFVNGQLVGSGLRGTEGAIDFLDSADLRLARRIRAGKTSRGVLLTHEGMAIAGERLYLLPEDGPSRLFVYRLPH